MYEDKRQIARTYENMHPSPRSYTQSLNILFEPMSNLSICVQLK